MARGSGADEVNYTMKQWGELEPGNTIMSSPIDKTIKEIRGKEQYEIDVLFTDGTQKTVKEYDYVHVQCPHRKYVRGRQPKGVLR